MKIRKTSFQQSRFFLKTENSDADVRKRDTQDIRSVGNKIYFIECNRNFRPQGPDQDQNIAGKNRYQGK